MVALSVAMMSTHAQVVKTTQDGKNSKTKEVVDSTMYERDGTLPDTLGFDRLAQRPQIVHDSDSVQMAEEAAYQILLLTRSYEDRIVLRWAPSEYVPFRFLRDAGYMVCRSWIEPKKGLRNDTLSIVKPWTQEQFKAKFAENDSLAAMAMELLYTKTVTLDQTEAAPGSMKSIVEVYEQQQEVAGFAMYIAEVRPDLAEAMGLMYTDREAKKGVQYIYTVAPNLPDSVLDCAWGTSNIVTLEKYKGSKLDIVLTDSVAPATQVFLYWPRENYSSYDIERRDASAGGEWKKLNNKPYISFVSDFMEEDADNFYQDNPGKIGTYEYRIFAYDSFGDRIGPSETHVVELPDLVPPMAPDIMQFKINYISDKKTEATIVFHKDSIEADLLGYIPMYRNDLRDTTAVWRQMTDKIISPRDTTITIDVSGLAAGHVALAAYDKAGNHSLSVEQLLNIDDVTPPSAPTNLRANVAPDGLLVLRWTAPPELDVAYYEVYTANDPTHVFQNQTNPEQWDTVYVDSLAQGLNQRYIYYKVKAVDGSGNSSEFSEMLPVLRPNYIPPMTCRADSVWVTDNKINIWWIQSNEEDLAYHRLFRKQEGDDVWTLMGVYNADSLRNTNDRIRFTDSPKPHMRKRYIYAVETTNLSGVTSGLSQTQSLLFTGPRIVNIPLKVLGDYRKDKKETCLVWETGKVPDYGPWYYCVYRKGADDKDFKFLLAVKSDEQQFTDYLLQPGQEAEYYMMIQYDDGRRSQRSNVVKVKAPAEK